MAIAAGYYLSTGRIPCVYLQNSGLGNIINPVASLLNEKVYGIPVYLSLDGVVSLVQRMSRNILFKEK